MLIKKIYLAASQQPWNVYKDGMFNEEEVLHALIRKAAPKLVQLGFEIKCSDPAKDLKANVAEANAWGADIYVSNHSNAFKGDNDGTLGLYVSLAGRKLAEYIYNEVAKVTPSSDEGLRQRTDLYELNQTNMPACLIEYFYHDNAADMKFGLMNLDLLAEALSRGLWKYAEAVRLGL